MLKINKKRWTKDQIKYLWKKPFLELLFKAQKIHRKNFISNQIQISSLLSIKTGYCPEDCKYCSQSAKNKTKLKKEKLIKLKKVIIEAKKAKKNGSTRFCMGAAWKNPNDRDMPLLEKMVKNVKSLGLETCMTLGMLTKKQAKKLSKAGLDYYNHNLDTSKNFYKNIITTRSYKDRLNTLEIIRKSGIKICSGGILGLGEKNIDRIELLLQLANLKKQPNSVPINMLVKIKGTPLFNNSDINLFDFIRTIAIARIIMPKSYIRLSAGREKMNEQTQTLCFIAGANSVFFGCKLLTTSNVEKNKDIKFFKKLGLNFINRKKTESVKYYEA